MKKIINTIIEKIKDFFTVIVLIIIVLLFGNRNKY
jgi:hypothetical protein